MVIFLHGEDSYRSGQKLNQIIKAYRKKNPSQLSFKKQEKGAEIQEIKDFLETQSMFAETKLLVLKDFFSEKKDKKEKLIDWLENSSLFSSKEAVVVFFENESPDKRTKLFKLLNKKAQSQEFESLEGRKLRDWIRKQIKSQGEVIITTEVLRILAERVGNNLWQLEKEIKKSVNHAFAQGKNKVEVSDVQNCVTRNIETDIFATIDALADRNSAQALQLLSKHLKKGEPELKVLSMFCYQFRNLIRVKSLQLEGISSSSELRSQTGLHPYVVKKTTALTSNFELEELKEYFFKLFEIDKGIKTGQVKNPSRALERFVVEVAGQ